MFDGRGRSSEIDKIAEMKQEPPSIHEIAFDCPHCGAFAQQSWYSLAANTQYLNGRLPIDIGEYILGDVINSRPEIRDAILAGFPALDPKPRQLVSTTLYCVFVSNCFRCRKVAIWIRNKLIYPPRRVAPPANPDLTEEIREDYDEARSILDLSPRGAAALLRLSIQKLCKELGGKGDNINDDIAALVAAGLSQQIQQALDTVRVIGNNAVHPGQIDLRDDRATALSLFTFVNLIADKMVSEPKRIAEAYDSLPDGALDAINKRDA